MSCTDNYVPIINTSGQQDTYVVSGQIVGTTLILVDSLGGTINIPLDGVEAAINFNNLTPAQWEALQLNIQGELYTDSFGVPLGYLLPL